MKVVRFCRRVEEDEELEGEGGREGRRSWKVWRTDIVSVSLGGKEQREGRGYDKESVVDHNAYYKVRSSWRSHD
jgi:hypothetical protein